MKEVKNTKLSFVNLVRESFSAGEKNLAIGSTGYHLIQKRILKQTINGIASTKPGVRFCVISFYDEKEFIDGKRLIHFTENELFEFQKAYDYIIWNLPDLEFLRNHENKFEKIFKLIDRFTVLSMKPTGINESEFIDYVKNYYIDHGFDGDFVARSSKKVVSKKKLLDRITQLISA